MIEVCKAIKEHQDKQGAGTIKITVERLRELAERRSPSLRWGESEEMAAMLLAIMEVQQVAVEAVTEIMVQEWGEWCADTGNFPDDFEWRGGNGILSYEPARWSKRVAERIIKLTASPVIPLENQPQQQDTTNCSAEPQTALYRWRRPGEMNWKTSPFPPLADGMEVQELIVRPKHG